jgi:hypothetical protein
MNSIQCGVATVLPSQQVAEVAEVVMANPILMTYGNSGANGNIGAILVDAI